MVINEIKKHFSMMYVILICHTDTVSYSVTVHTILYVILIQCDTVSHFTSYDNVIQCDAVSLSILISY